MKPIFVVASSLIPAFLLTGSATTPDEPFELADTIVATATRTLGA